MSGYGQFCPLAKAAEVVGERWTPLILRELLFGSCRFNQIHRGVPRMSPSLLSRRLKTLEQANILVREVTADGTTYRLTRAGHDLLPAIRALGEWGKRWMPDILEDADVDPDVIMLDMERRIDLAAMPATWTVVRFELSDQPRNRRYWWLIGNNEGVEFCIVDPGHEVDLFVATDARTLTHIWYGDIAIRRAIAQGQLDLHGPPALCRAFPDWLLLSVLADIPRAGTDLTAT